ncbi:flagellar protein FlaG [Abyssibacter sp.]|jgi:flagellar protein FlaG|uniref:flagellar protein FlaG n=1 Tax=Abyssibacter sp. TaxID=2320200 RepID=UPI000C3B35EE|nr:flagellar protein FlaG [Abyssibacter sp.]MBB86784.1 hypothetical protein [Xanthomonadales bacterium]MCK5858518.1 flagellar protein FlaG [Abyssibacter sp.]
MSEDIRINPITDALRERPDLPMPYPPTREHPPAVAEANRDDRAFVSDEATHRAVNKINATLIGARTSLRFRVDGEAELLVVSVVDDVTGDVLQQMPAQDVVEAARRLHSGQMHTLDVSA